MPDHGSTSRSSKLIKLGTGIRDLLVQSDALGLPYVAIHLCNALESLEAEAPMGDMSVGTDGADGAGPLPG
ncbi:hypothetical protein ACFOON_13000 [Novosphingobium piscinae]|uniref:Uncharacterized protein n=1 Tax=Novosphingobium piscinae TaxID=1507448 RepID=A0A7X1FZ72_9SPHN|nr:hypothetical protein [Novosphingobium piscinae]MBC2669693.1 hypothetical protein [Novosphingobium piscinae]